jgi:hypothetical protein
MSLHGAAKSLYLRTKRAATDNRLLDHKWFLEQEANSWTYRVDLSLRRRLWLWRRGFTSPNGKLYDFDEYGPEEYLSERQKYRLYREMNGDHRYLVDDKLSQHWMLAGYPDHRPTAYGFVDRGDVHGLAGTAYDGDPMPVSAWLPDALRSHGKLVLKQLRGHGGSEVHVAASDGDGFTFDDEPVSEAALCETVADLAGYLVTEYVDQHAYADELYPHAANTIRVLTLWDDETGQLHTPMAVHRIGTDRSRPVDNVSTGGITAKVDLATGELGPGVQKLFDDGLPWHSVHPDTGARIEGATVPEWDAVRETVETLARANTHVPAIGWDLVVDESGTPVVLEANTGTDVELFQVHRPLLADPDVARVVARYLPEVGREGDHSVGGMAESGR